MKKVIMAERSDIYHDARVLKEAESLFLAGYEVEIVGLRAKKKSDDSSFKFKINTYYVLPRKYKILRKLHLLLLIFFINGKLIFRKADIYHAHNTFFLVGMYFAKKIYESKLIYDSHEVQWELNSIAGLLEKLFIKKVDKIINVSTGRAKVQALKYKIDENSISVISNYPVFNSNNLYRKHSFDNSNVRFIFSGGVDLNDNKIDNFITALSDFPNVKFHLLSFSYGNSGKKIKDLILEKRLSDRVGFIPLVAPGEVINTISKYDFSVNMMVNPNNLVSINYHSINKIYEAIAAGLPILCSNLPAFEQEIVKNKIGFSIDPYNIASIREGIKRLINISSDEYYEMRFKALSLAKERFNWTLEEEKLLKLYNEVLCAE